MAYGWSARDQLCPMRMVYDVPHDHLHDVVKWERRKLRRRPKLPFLRNALSRVEEARQRHAFAAGRLGEWPVFRYRRRR